MKQLNVWEAHEAKAKSKPLVDCVTNPENSPASRVDVGECSVNPELVKAFKQCNVECPFADTQTEQMIDPTIDSTDTHPFVDSTLEAMQIHLSIGYLILSLIPLSTTNRQWWPSNQSHHWLCYKPSNKPHILSSIISFNVYERHPCFLKIACIVLYSNLAECLEEAVYVNPRSWHQSHQRGHSSLQWSYQLDHLYRQRNRPNRFSHQLYQGHQPNLLRPSTRPSLLPSEPTKLLCLGWWLFRNPWVYKEAL